MSNNKIPAIPTKLIALVVQNCGDLARRFATPVCISDISCRFTPSTIVRLDNGHYLRLIDFPPSVFVLRPLASAQSVHLG